MLEKTSDSVILKDADHADFAKAKSARTDMAEKI
jgi:hypothetical protein